MIGRCWGGGREVEERARVCYLSRQQRVGIEALHAADQLVLGVHHVVHKRPANQEPVRASVHGDALGDLAVPEAPHVRVALKEEAVQTLLTDEAGGGRQESDPEDPPCPSKYSRLDSLPY